MGIYAVLGVLFLTGALGNFFSVAIQWNHSDIGQKIGGIAGILINALIGILMFYYRDQQKNNPMMMGADEFNEVFNNEKEGKNEKILGRKTKK